MIAFTPAQPVARLRCDQIIRPGARGGALHRQDRALGSDQDVATSENDICLEEINQMSRHVATFA